MSVVQDRPTSWTHDVAAGCLVAVVGIGAIVIGQSYGVGTLRQMGPGFFPVAVGVILTGIGLALGMAGWRTRAEQTTTDAPLFERPDWRGWAFIVGGIVAFLILGMRAGLAPAGFGCVFISALGDRTMTLKRAFVLALSITVIGTILFAYILKIQMPIVPGWQL